METIKNYLDNMFANLPKTTRIADLKANLLSNMEDKYNELKAQGKSENEAIGIVISEFGNIDELIEELGINRKEEINTQPQVTQEEVEAYLNVKKTMGLQIGIGVFLCILGAAMFLLITKLLEHGVFGGSFLEDNSGIPGLIALFVLITIAVGIFIYSGMNFEKYQYMEKGVHLSNSVRERLQMQYDSNTPTFYFSLILGVGLIIIAPVALIITSLVDDDYSEYGVVILLILVAISVFLFIYFGTTRESMQRLLKLGDYAPKQTKDNKVIGAIASIIWPLATIAFLFWGFVYNGWGIAWIIFPITGIFFGMISAVYSILTNKEEQ
jgi:hypothetical protein